MRREVHDSADSKHRPPRNPRATATPASSGASLATPLSATPNHRHRRNVEDGSLGISAVCARIFGLRFGASEQEKGVGWLTGWSVGRVFGEETECDGMNSVALWCTPAATRTMTHKGWRYRWLCRWPKYRLTAAKSPKAANNEIDRVKRREIFMGFYLWSCGFRTKFCPMTNRNEYKV